MLNSIKEEEDTIENKVDMEDKRSQFSEKKLKPLKKLL